MKKRWKKAKRRFSTDNPFYGVINSENAWIDSANSFALACQWAAYNAGEYEARTYEEKLAWMETEGAKLGYSIVHSNHLEHMVESGLISNA